MQEDRVMAKYGKKAQSKVEKTMHERKAGTLRSGKSGKKVKSRKQAIAIGLSEARRAGGKVPAKKSSKRGAKKSSSKRSSAKKSSSKRSSAKKSSSKRSSAKKKRKTTRKSPSRKSSAKKSRTRKSTARKSK
jgi:hypothetical protein